MVVVDTHADHADLTDEYASITREMRSVAEFFGKKMLIDVDENEFFARMGELSACVSDRAILRARHFFDENRNVIRLYDDKAVSVDELGEELSAFDEKIYLAGDGAEICFNAFKEKIPDVVLSGENRRYQRAYGTALAALPDNVGNCPQCGAVAAKGKLCDICADPRRDASQLCVVETMTQLFSVEKGNYFRGRYLVLGGRLSPLDGEDGSNLRISLLKERAALPETKEVILALSSDVEGRATAAFLSELLSGIPVKLTRPALGLPAGASLSYADSATIAAAFIGRTDMQ
jgi:recombination protein RecR